MFDIRLNILQYAAHRLFTIDEEKLFLLNTIRLSGGNLRSAVFRQCGLLLETCKERIRPFGELFGL